MPLVHWAITSFGLETINNGAPITGIRRPWRIGGRLTARDTPDTIDEARDAFVDAGLGLEAMVALDRADVGKGLADVTDLHRLGIEYRFAAGFLLEELDDPHQIFAAAVADIVKRMRRGAAAGLGSPSSAGGPSRQATTPRTMSSM